MTAASANEPWFEELSRLLVAATGLTFAAHSSVFAKARMRKVMAGTGITNPGDYLASLRSGRCTLDALVAELTIQESYFFRDDAQLAFIRAHVLPRLRAHRDPSRPIRVWSAGCAAGEEAYSLAILLEQEGLAESATILGTDISRPALARARAGRYGSWALRASNPAFVDRYFHLDSGRHAIADRFHRRVRFEYLNLAADGYPSQSMGTAAVDLILCRNVLIYLDPPTIKRIAQGFLRSLAPGGYLITGPSDPLLSDAAPFETVVSEAGIVYRCPDDPPAKRIGHHPGGIGAIEPVRITRPTSEPRPRMTVAGPMASTARTLGAGILGGVTLDGAAPGRTSQSNGDAATASRVARIRSLADGGDRDGAERAVAVAAWDAPLVVEFHFLHALILMDLSRSDEALAAVRRVLYLDRDLASAHWVHGSVLEQLGKPAEAYAAYRNAHRLLADRPTEEAIPLFEGETAGRLAASLAARLTSGQTMDEPVRERLNR